MDLDALVGRLRAHRTLAAAPLEQLAWVAARGRLMAFPAGETLVRTGEPIDELYVVLEGRFCIRVNRGNGWRRVLEWRGGDVGGLLPYSRMKASPGETRTDEPTEVVSVHREHFRDMARECHELTALLVHVMLDRARHFRSSDLHDEKLASLGRLAAGLAHELNNPASAAARSAEVLLRALPTAETAYRALGTVLTSPAEMAAFDDLRLRCLAAPLSPPRSSLERAERAEAVGAWLESHGVDLADAEVLAECGADLDSLAGAARVLGERALAAALAAVAASCRTQRLAADVERASARVHELVAAVKGFTYMDQATVPKPVDLARGLNDTLTILGSKARSRSVHMHVEVQPDLPTVEGFGGELNQVWANLVDNAIDAAAGGHVEVTARREGAGIVVRVVDDGPGIPAEVRERMFEPFFTTRPTGEGAGLGLAIVRSLVAQHDGEIEVDSRTGRTEFRVTLPVGAQSLAGE